MTRKRLRLTAVACLALVALFMAGCVEKSINQIKAEPDRYANREVGIRGEVTESFSILGRGAYQVDDGTGKLWVVSDRGVPRKGSHVAVKGKIRDGFDMGSFIKLPEKISSGMVMIESDHKAKYPR
jgi:hypothetical protein